MNQTKPPFQQLLEPLDDMLCILFGFVENQTGVYNKITTR